MSSLKFSEKNLVEKILEMRTGYVSDFSDRTLKEFVLDETGIDIFTPEYEEGGTSKANRIRTFWTKQPDEITADLIEALLSHAQREKTDYDRELSARDLHLFVEARKIVQRLRDEPEGQSRDTASPAVPTSGLIIEARGNINNSGHIRAAEGQTIAMRSLGEVTHSGSIEFVKSMGQKIKIGPLVYGAAILLIALVSIPWWPQWLGALGVPQFVQSSEIATTTPDVADILAVVNKPKQTPAEALTAKTYGEKYTGAAIHGVGTYESLWPLSEGFVLNIRTSSALVSCYFDKSAEQQLLLLKNDQRISFGGVYGNSATFGGGYSIRDCYLR